jgi:hypothetical protein
MDTKKLTKLIKLVVEQEVKKQLPQLIKEEIAKSQKISLKESKSVEIEDDPFALAEKVLQRERQNTNKEFVNESQSYTQPKKQFTKNPVINQILNETRPFSSSERNPEVKSVLDKFVQQPINEGYSNSHIPNYLDAEPDIDETFSATSVSAQLGLESMRSQMASKMGYGDMNPSGVPKSGLGVKTGLAGLDRILNRDNSELVKRFKK